MEKTPSTLLNVLKFHTLNRILKYNPNAVIFLDHSEELCEIFYSCEQYCIFIEKDKKYNIIDYEYYWIDYNKRYFINASGNRVSPIEPFDTSLIPSKTKEKFLLQCNEDIIKHGEKSIEYTETELHHPLPNMFEKLAKNSKIYIDTNKFSQKTLEHFQYQNTVRKNVFIFDGEYKKQMEAIIKTATKFINEYGGVITGSCSLAIYNYLNDLPYKFIPDDIDVVFTSHEMYIYCSEIFLGSLTPEGKDEYDICFMSRKFLFENLTVNIILPGEARKNLSHLMEYVIDKKNFNKVLKSQLVSPKIEGEDLIYSNVYFKFRSVEDEKHVSSRSGYPSLEELEYLINLIEAKNFERVYKILDVDYDKDDTNLVKNYADLPLDSLKCKRYSTWYKLALILSFLSFPATYADYANMIYSHPESWNKEYTIVTNRGKSMEKSFIIGLHGENGLISKLKRSYINEVLEEKQESYYREKTIEYIRNKPEISTDYNIAKNYIDSFDFEFCKLIWVPNGGFHLTNHHPLISAKYSTALCKKESFIYHRFIKYASRGYKIIII